MATQRSSGRARCCICEGCKSLCRAIVVGAIYGSFVVTMVLQAA